MKKHHISLLHAWEGILTGFKTQPNFRIHLFFSLLSLIGVWIFKVNSAELAIILFTIAAGLAFELINTAIEFTVDLLTDEYHILAKFAKDTAAGAMLIYAFFSICVAFTIFLPKIWLFF